MYEGQKTVADVSTASVFTVRCFI